MMKKTLLILGCCLALIPNVFAAPGDILPDALRALWDIESSNYDSSHVTSAMNSLPANGGQAAVPRDHWVFWMQIYFGDTGTIGTVYSTDIYYVMLSKIVGYGFDNAHVADEYQAPKNALAVGTTITCDEDPTGADRTVLLYAKVNGNRDYEESSIAGVLASGTWTFTAVTGASNGKYVLAYDDNYQSFPTDKLTVLP